MQNRGMKKASILAASVSLVLAAGVAGYREHLKSNLLDVVRHELADPDTAKFRGVRISSNWTPAGGMACGEVNARNRLGAYVGFQKFVVMADGLRILGDDGLVTEMCSVLDDPSPWWYVPQ